MGKGSRLLLLPWLWPLLSFPWSPFFSSIQRWCMKLGMQLLQVDFWGDKKGKSMQPVLERVPLFSPCCIYTPLQCKGVFGRWTKVFLIPLWLSLGWFLFPFSPRVGRSNTNFLLSFTVSLPIQKSTMSIVSLPIHKLVAKLCPCQFRNQQPIVSLPNKKSAAKNSIVPDLWNQQRCWSHFGFTSLSFLVFQDQYTRVS